MNDNERQAEREALLERIDDEIRETARATGVGRLSRPVRAALLATPRHRFVPAQAQASAYDNRPLAIGGGQTISQPYIVALMTELAAVQPGDRVLEVGTGSGYQAAVLAHLVEQLYSIETLPALARQAEEALLAAGLDNVTLRIGDGTEGWPEQAPFDAIIVTAAAAEVPKALITQLAPGGRLVIPIGLPHDYQELRVLTKDSEGRVTTRTILPVAFVPLVGHGPSSRRVNSS